MRRCAGCGGVLGRDCWNEQDCVWITQDMLRQASRQHDLRDNACQGCSMIATDGGYSECLGLCADLTCQEDVDARRALWKAIPTTFADGRITPVKGDQCNS